MPSPAAHRAVSGRSLTPGTKAFVMQELTQLIPIVLIIAVFYFLLIRPQQKRARQHRELVSSIETGDRIVTIGGLHGTVEAVDEDTVHLQLVPGTTVTVSKQAVSRRLVDADTGEEASSEATGSDESDPS